MSVNVPLHKWRSADPTILIGRRCIARTDQDVIIDGRLELIRLWNHHASHHQRNEQ